MIFGTLLALLFALGTTSFVRGLDLKSTDVFATGHFPHPDIVILAIDDKSIMAIGRWPWPRSVEASVINKLGNYSPRAVGIDINFSEPEDMANDTALVMNISSAKFPVVLPVETIRMSDGSSQYLYPLPALVSLPNVSLGHVDVSLSADGMARSLPDPLQTQNGKILPWGEMITKQANGIIPDPSTTYAINFAGPAGTFATYSISDFLSGTIPSEKLDQKIILIGATANDLHDVVPVPEMSGVMAGVEWHANIIDNILLNRLDSVAPPIFVDLAGVLLAILLLILFSHVRTKTASFVVLAALIVVPLISYLTLRQNILIPYFWNEIVIVVTFGAYGSAKWYAAELEKRRIKRTVQNYFSPAVLDTILKNPKSLSLGGERKEVTILFSDIRSFTTITESTPPEVLSRLLHEYFTEMAEEIFATDGVLDKFIGDAIMAFWGAPLEQHDHADRAMRAALDMMRRLAGLQLKWADEGLPFVDIGIGIHTGHAIVGNMGSEKRFDYTAIGDTVNAASRLEGLNKEYKTHIIISEATKRKLKDPVAVNELGEVTVKGKTAALKIYSVD